MKMIIGEIIPAQPIESKVVAPPAITIGGITICLLLKISYSFARKASQMDSAKRSKIKKALGDIKGANDDYAESRRLKEKYDLKRIKTCKLIAEMEHTPFSYFYLAHAYEIAGDYENALDAIDKAIELTELNNQYKRYRAELENKKGI